MAEKKTSYLHEWTEIWRSVDLAYDKLLRHFNVSANTYCVLSLLLRKPDGVGPAQIAETVLIKRQMVALILNDLESKGWIIRQELKTDHRRKHIFLTDTGKKFIRNMDKVMMDANLQGIRKMSGEDQEKFLALAKVFLQSFQREISRITGLGEN